MRTPWVDRDRIISEREGKESRDGSNRNMLGSFGELRVKTDRD